MAEVYLILVIPTNDSAKVNCMQRVIEHGIIELNCDFILQISTPRSVANLVSSVRWYYGRLATRSTLRPTYNCWSGRSRSSDTSRGHIPRPR